MPNLTTLILVDRIARGVYEVQDRTIFNKKEAIDIADIEVGKWVRYRFEKSLFFQSTWAFG